QRERHRRHLRPVGQPQLRGPGEPRRAGQLSGLAAAGRRLRPGRLDAHRHHEGSHRSGQEGQGRLPRRHLGRPRRKSPTSSASRSRRPCSPSATRTSSRAISTGRRSRSRAARPTPGTTARPTSPTRPISRACRWSRSRFRTSSRAACSPSSATRSPPTTSPRPARSRRPRPPV
ncbi:hypothetical protein GMDG_08992, partial [Pseudogymnoascus destructans 20631-21]